MPEAVPLEDLDEGNLKAAYAEVRFYVGPSYRRWPQQPCPTLGRCSLLAALVLLPSSPLLCRSRRVNPIAIALFRPPGHRRLPPTAARRRPPRRLNSPPTPRSPVPSAWHSKQQIRDAELCSGTWRGLQRVGFIKHTLD